MKVLVVGGGGREHAIIKKIKENKIYIIFGLIVYIFLNYLFYYFRVTFANDSLSGFNYLFEKPQYLLYAFPLSLNWIDLFIPLIIIGFLSLVIFEKKRTRRIIEKASNMVQLRGGILTKT